MIQRAAPYVPEPTRVHEIMSKDVPNVEKDERLDAVLERMAKARVSRMLVVDGDELVGTITDGDIADELGAIKNRRISASHLHASSAMRRDVPTVGPDTELGRVMEVIDEAGGIVPVVHNKTPIGAVTSTMLLAHVEADTHVSEIMTTPVHVVSLDDRVIHARRLMLDHGVERLPVLDEGKIVGLIAELDVALGLARVKDTASSNHQQARVHRLQVFEVMRQTVVQCAPETSVTEAARRMREEHVGALPVTRDGRLLGIVTRSDLLKFMKK